MEEGGKRFARITGAVWIAFASTFILSGSVQAQESDEEVSGGDLWRQGGCFDCHGNLAAGDGDPVYPDGPNLRRTTLDADQLIMTISCGRPVTGMPMYLEGAYTETPCYGMELGEIPDGIDVGGSFSAEEIETLVDFLMEHVVGQTRITRENCAAFYNGNMDAPACLRF